jgi:branched-chain amino acid transport system ATP-binding protein
MPSSGDLYAQGQRLTGAAAHRYAQHGIARTFQTPRVFAELSVAANIDFGLQFAGRGRTAS